MTTTIDEAIATIAQMDIADICNRSLINLQSDTRLDTQIPSEGLLMLSRLRQEFIILIDGKKDDCTIEEIALTGADLFEKCLPEWNSEKLEAVIDLVSYGEELPEGVSQQLDLIEIAEYSLFVQMQRFWDTLTEEIALFQVIPN